MCQLPRSSAYCNAQIFVKTYKNCEFLGIWSNPVLFCCVSAYPMHIRTRYSWGCQAGGEMVLFEYCSCIFWLLYSYVELLSVTYLGCASSTVTPQEASGCCSRIRSIQKGCNEKPVPCLLPYLHNALNCNSSELVLHTSVGTMHGLGISALLWKPKVEFKRHQYTWGPSTHPCPFITLAKWWSPCMHWNYVCKT